MSSTSCVSCASSAGSPCGCAEARAALAILRSFLRADITGLGVGATILGLRRVFVPVPLPVLFFFRGNGFDPRRFVLLGESRGSGECGAAGEGGGESLLVPSPSGVLKSVRVRACLHSGELLDLQMTK